MKQTYSVLQVRIRLDPIPGWGHSPDDYLKMVHDYLRKSIPWYNPSVKLLGTEVEDDSPN